MDMNANSIRNNCFVIPFNNEYVIYAPLQNVAFVGNEFAAAIVEKFISGASLTQMEEDSIVGQYIKQICSVKVLPPTTKDLKPISSIVIILSQQCNLACSYCFAQKARSNTVLSLESIKAGIDCILYNSESKSEFVFIGGGEPLVTWDQLYWAINYIYDNKPIEKEISISITTNATLFTEERIRFLKEHNVSITISFEVLPQIQNSQRTGQNFKNGTFNIVDKAIKNLESYGVPCTIRSTITNHNVHLLTEMVEFSNVHYKSIKKLHFEPVSSSMENNELFYQNYIDSFFNARNLGKKYGIDVYNSISRSVEILKARFCRGEFCLTPNGSIVACHRFSSEKDLNFNNVLYGQINTQLIIDEEKRQSVLSIFNKKNTECVKCFAKWHCAGGCPAERLIHSEEQNKQKCEFTQNIVSRIIYEKVKP